MKEKIKKIIAIIFIVISILINVWVSFSSLGYRGLPYLLGTITSFLLIPTIITFFIFLFNRFRHKEHNLWNYLWYFSIIFLLVSFILLNGELNRRELMEGKTYYEYLQYLESK